MCQCISGRYAVAACHSPQPALAKFVWIDIHDCHFCIVVRTKMNGFNIDHVQNEQKKKVKEQTTRYLSLNKANGTHTRTNALGLVRQRECLFLKCLYLVHLYSMRRTIMHIYITLYYARTSSHFILRWMLSLRREHITLYKIVWNCCCL